MMLVFEEITISEGDTLWGCLSHYAENMPTEKWIKESDEIEQSIICNNSNGR